MQLFHVCYYVRLADELFRCSSLLHLRCFFYLCSRRRGSVTNKRSNANHNDVKVFDTNGQDVTPKFLSLNGVKNIAMADEQSSLQQALIRQEETLADFPLIDDDDYAHAAKQLFMQRQLELDSKKETAASHGATDGKHKHREREAMEQMAKMTEKEGNEQVTINLTETPTFNLLHISGLLVWGEDTALMKQVTSRNAAYEAMLLKHIEKDKYSARHAQTFNNTTREKQIQAAAPAVKNVGVSADTWDIWDSYHAHGSG